MATKRDSRAPCAQKVVSRHEQLIRDLVASDPDIHRNGFGAAIRDLAGQISEWPEELEAKGFLPDAYKIDRESETVILYEIEVSHSLSSDKLAQLGMFWFDWDADDHHEWLPELRVINRYGSVSTVDLCRAYHGDMIARYRPDRLNSSDRREG